MRSTTVGPDYVPQVGDVLKRWGQTVTIGAIEGESLRFTRIGADGDRYDGTRTLSEILERAIGAELLREDGVPATAPALTQSQREELLEIETAAVALEVRLHRLLTKDEVHARPGLHLAWGSLLEACQTLKADREGWE